MFEWKNGLASSWSAIQGNRLWHAYQGESTYGDFTNEYRIGIKQLRILAESLGRTEALSRLKGVRVTDFTKWVMSLYLGPPDPMSLDWGKQIERRVARLEKPSHNPSWELVYLDPLKSAPIALRISSLTVDGAPLWGVPDIVYRNLSTGALLIVERKASDKPIPVNGWPNLRAQLWAYGLIDEFKNVPVITLIGEIWGLVDGRLTRRGVLRWSANDKNFDVECTELFLLYGGQRNG